MLYQLFESLHLGEEVLQNEEHQLLLRVLELALLQQLNHPEEEPTEVDLPQDH
jgi:hypothetical protein